MAPTDYDRTVANNPLPVIYASTNNVFVNETLFNIYSIYIQETVLPIIQMFDSDTSLFQWLVPLNNVTRLYATETTFLRTYSCSKRENLWLFRFAEYRARRNRGTEGGDTLKDAFLNGNFRTIRVLDKLPSKYLISRLFLLSFFLSIA